MMAGPDPSQPAAPSGDISPMHNGDFKVTVATLPCRRRLLIRWNRFYPKSARLPESAQLSARATSAAQYVRMMSAPARLMAVSDSMIARSRSIHPLAAAASIIAYSPLT
jgi:hypothetical protein